MFFSNLLTTISGSEKDSIEYSKITVLNGEENKYSRFFVKNGFKPVILKW